MVRGRLVPLCISSSSDNKGMPWEFMEIKWKLPMTRRIHKCIVAFRTAGSLKSRNFPPQIAPYCKLFTIYRQDWVKGISPMISQKISKIFSPARMFILCSAWLSGEFSDFPCESGKNRRFDSNYPRNPHPSPLLFPWFPIRRARQMKPPIPPENRIRPVETER